MSKYLFVIVFYTVYLMKKLNLLMSLDVAENHRKKPKNDLWVKFFLMICLCKTAFMTYDVMHMM